MKPILAGAMLLHLVCLSLAAPEVFYGQENVPKYYFGALKDDNEERVPLKEHNVTNDIIPRFFDARENWPHCPSIREIRNQGACGSCWAVAAAETMTDRLCILSNGTQQFHFSSEHILSCCPQELCCGEEGCCAGGRPLMAWEMYIEDGIVSGGEFESYQGCQPYEIPLHRKENSTPRCQQRCESGYYKHYDEDLHYGDGVFRLNGELHMQIEILLHGPIQASFQVFENFVTWDQKGVYVPGGGETPYGHSVKVIGWGEEEDGTPFWLVANSYGRQWGDGGFFRFLRRSKIGSIEWGAIAGVPKL